MARGKHAAAARKRAAEHLAANLAEVHGELAQEQELLAAAKRALGDIRQLEERLNTLRNVTRVAADPEIKRLRAEEETLASVLPGVRDDRREIQHSWETFIGEVMNRLGGGAEGFEHLHRILNGVHRINWAENGRHLSEIGAQRVQQARHERRRINPSVAAAESEPEETDDSGLGSLLRQRLKDRLPTGAASQQDWTQDQRRAEAASRGLPTRRIDDLDIEAIHAWHPTRWVDFNRDDGTGVWDALGFDTLTAPSLGGFGSVSALHADLTATARSAMTGVTPDDAAAEWLSVHQRSARVTGAAKRVPHPHAERPLHPRPGDAVSYQHWYSVASFGNWLRADNLQDEGTPVFAETAVAAAAAVPFWVPPGQIGGYLNSEPLAAQDRADLRLPYAQVLLTMSDGLHLPALNADPDLPVNRSLEFIDRALLHFQTVREVRLRDYLHEAGQEVVDKPPLLSEIIAARGALVEGVLLTGDALGNPADRFAWCLAIPGRYGGIIGRFTVPALRSKTRYAEYLLDMLALASWADWHAPDPEIDRLKDERGLDGSTVRAIEQRGGAGVRVLKVRASRSTDTTDGQGGTGRTVTPHVRRGHWRRQHYGAGRAEVKRVRIAPVLVNAGRGGLAPRVYRLPGMN